MAELGLPLTPVVQVETDIDERSGPRLPYAHTCYRLLSPSLSPVDYAWDECVECVLQPEAVREEYG